VEDHFGLGFVIPDDNRTVSIDLPGLAGLVPAERQRTEFSQHAGDLIRGPGFACRQVDSGEVFVRHQLRVVVVFHGKVTVLHGIELLRQAKARPFFEVKR